MAFIHQGGDIDGPSSQLQQCMRIKSKLNGYFLTVDVNGKLVNSSSRAQLWCVQFYGGAFTITYKDSNANQWAMSSGTGLPGQELTFELAPSSSSPPPPVTQLWKCVNYDDVYYYIKTAQSSGNVLDINGSSPNDPAQVLLQPLDGGNNQLFSFEPVPVREFSFYF